MTCEPDKTCRAEYALRAFRKEVRMLNLYDLTIEYKTEPIGLDELQPRFSWKLKSDRNDTWQSAYRITVSHSEVIWDTGRVENSQSVLIEYMGEVLEARTAYTWNVTVWDNHGESASASAVFETGLLSGTAFDGPDNLRFGFGAGNARKQHRHFGSKRHTDVVQIAFGRAAQHFDRFDHLKRIAHCRPERTAHIGNQRRHPSSARLADCDHVARERARVIGRFHKSAGAN